MVKNAKISKIEKFKFCKKKKYGNYFVRYFFLYLVFCFMYDSIHHFNPLNKFFLSFRSSFTLQEQIFDSKSSIRNYFFWRLFDPKNVNNLFDNLETQAYLAPKNVFKWPNVCQSNEILNL